MRELVPGFENLNSRGARVDGGAFITLSPVIFAISPHGKLGSESHPVLKDIQLLYIEPIQLRISIRLFGTPG